MERRHLDGNERETRTRLFDFQLVRNLRKSASRSLADCRQDDGVPCAVNKYMKAILTLLLVLSSALALLGFTSYRAGNGLGIVPLIGGSIFAVAILTIWTLTIIKEKKDAQAQAARHADFDDLDS